MLHAPVSRMSFKWVTPCREELQTQIAGFRQRWFGRMHRVDKFFHRVRPPPGSHMETHRGDRGLPTL